VNETALNAISKGSNMLNQGEVAKPAVEIPKSDATGLAHTPTHAPLLQQAKNNGMMELMLPVIVVQIDFNLFMLFCFLRL
jgi:hypothetical protein